MKSLPPWGCWREKRSPPKTGIKAESAARGGTPSRSRGANPTPTTARRASQQPPQHETPPRTGTGPSCSSLVASPPGGEFGPKRALWHAGKEPATGGRSHRVHVSWLRAPPARRLPRACKPPAGPPSTPAGPRKPPAAPGRAAAGQGEPPATPPDYLFPPRSESLSFGERRGSGRERLPATKEAGDRDLTPTEVYLVSARPTTISSLIPSELGSHYSPRDSVNNQ